MRPGAVIVFIWLLIIGAIAAGQRDARARSCWFSCCGPLRAIMVETAARHALRPAPRGTLSEA